MKNEVRNALRAALEAYMHHTTAELDMYQLCTLIGVNPVPRCIDSQRSAVALVASRALPRYDSSELGGWRASLGTDKVIAAAEVAELWTSADAVAHSIR